MASVVQKHTISSIKDKILRPALTSHYICNFTPPQTKYINDKLAFWGVTGNADNIYDNVALACCEASLPGSSVATVDIDNDYHGVSEKHAYRRLYDDRADFTFYVSMKSQNEYFVIKFFEAWIGYVVNENALGKKTNTNSKNYSYRMNYPTNYYANSLSITKFERDYGLGNSSLLSYQFVNAYPISINSMPVSYDQSDLLKCTVSFFYTRYNVSSSKASNPASASNAYAPGIVGLNQKYGPAFGSDFEFFQNNNVKLPSQGEGTELINAYSVKQIEAGLPYVGRNVGPLAPFSGI